MKQVRVWFRPDGRVGYSDLSPAPNVEVEWQRILTQRGLPSDTPYVDMDVAELPSREVRHKWRKHPTETSVIVDNLVPDPPHPKQAMIDDINRAASIADLKKLMLRLV